MISYRFVPISSQKGVLFFETPGTFCKLMFMIESQSVLTSLWYCACFLVSYLSESFCPEFPKKRPKVLCPKFFWQNFRSDSFRF